MFRDEPIFMKGAICPRNTRLGTRADGVLPSEMHGKNRGGDGAGQISSPTVDKDFRMHEESVAITKSMTIQAWYRQQSDCIGCQLCQRGVKHFIENGQKLSGWQPTMNGGQRLIRSGPDGPQGRHSPRHFAIPICTPRWFAQRRPFGLDTALVRPAMLYISFSTKSNFAEELKHCCLQLVVCQTGHPLSLAGCSGYLVWMAPMLLQGLYTQNCLPTYLRSPD